MDTPPTKDEILAYSFTKWKDLSHIYTGTYGSVFKAIDTKQDEKNQTVVLKFSRINKEIGTVELRETYLFQQQQAGNINIPHMVGFRGVEFTDDRKFSILVLDAYTMNATHFMRNPRIRLTPQQKCDFAQQMATAICKMFAGFHAIGWLYRDLKAHHILFKEDKKEAGRWELAICDFGLASPLALESTRPEDLVSRFPVTYWCFAPELTNASDAPVTFGVDFWALGYFLVEFWIGSTTALGTTSASATVMKKQFDGILADMRNHQQTHMAHFVSWCLEWCPSKRCSSARDALAHPWLCTTASSTSSIPQPICLSIKAKRRIPRNLARLLTLLFPDYALDTHHRIYAAYRSLIQSNSLYLFTVFAHIYVKLFHHAPMHSIQERLQCMLHVRNHGEVDMQYETERILSIDNDQYLEFEIRIVDICFTNKNLL